MVACVDISRGDVRRFDRQIDDERAADIDARRALLTISSMIIDTHQIVWELEHDAAVAAERTLPRTEARPPAAASSASFAPRLIREARHENHARPPDRGTVQRSTRDARRHVGLGLAFGGGRQSLELGASLFVVVASCSCRQR